MPKLLKKKHEWFELKVTGEIEIRTAGDDKLHISYSGGPGVMLDQMTISKKDAKKLAEGLEEISNA